MKATLKSALRSSKVWRAVFLASVTFAIVPDFGTNQVGAYDLIDRNGNVVATVSQAGFATTLTGQGVNQAPAVSITQLTAAQAETSPMRNVITRAVGTQDEVDADVIEFAVMPGDLYLLASDGLMREVDDERVLVLTTGSGRDKTSALDFEQIGSKGGASLFHVRNGKVSRFVGYWDRAHALADLGLEE